MGFKFSQEYNIGQLDKEHFLALAVEAALQLKWNITFISKNGFIANTYFSWKSWGEEIIFKIDNNIVSIKSECFGDQLHDYGKNKKNIEDLISKIAELEETLSEDEIKLKISELRKIFSSKEIFLDKPDFNQENKTNGFLTIFKPVEGYFISPILININIFIFIIMAISGVSIISPQSQDLLNWGANFKPMTLDGEWWRLFTNIFLHIGILHLLFNMYALFYIGILLEPCIGRIKFLIGYLISGILASVTSLYWNDLVVSAGASGSIFGMYGIFIALLTTNLINKSIRRELLTNILIFVAYNIIYGLIPNSGIDNAAHLGGLLSGLIIGYFFVPGLKNSNNKKIDLFLIGILIILTFSFSYAIYKLPNDMREYERDMKNFMSLQEKALKIFKLPKETQKEKLLLAINNGINYWKEILKLVNNFKNYNLPIEIVERNQKLKEYTELRIKSYELIYKSVSENTSKYDKEIEEYSKKIELILSELNN